MHENPSREQIAVGNALQRIHFIAIGGAVMHNLAIALQAKGCTVSGSDDEIFEPSRSRLLQSGLLPKEIGWDPSRISPALDAVVLGMHARADNPELLRARELGIRIYSYPEFIYEQSRDKMRIAVCGSHGKTTITAMIMHCLRYYKRDFDYLVGAGIEGFDNMVRISNAPLIVMEGDEYFASPIDKTPKFLFYHPQIAVLSGIAWDHYNVYPEYSEYVNQFAQLAEALPPDALFVCNSEDAEVCSLISHTPIQAGLRFYNTPRHDIRGGITSLSYLEQRYPLQIFGRHNLQNLGAAAAACACIGIRTRAFYKAMQSFPGASRRLEKIAETSRGNVYRDFAHAPSKVRASVLALKEQFPKRKLVACLELHTFSSLNKGFLPQYAGTMSSADTAIIFLNAHAMEAKQLPPVHADEIRAFFAEPSLLVAEDSDTLKEMLHAAAGTDVNYLFMSSGHFNNFDFRDFL